VRDRIEKWSYKVIKLQEIRYYINASRLGGLIITLPGDLG